ncbi:MAG: protease inhibitor I42 family protein [Acidobacteria bacterium]|jgi:inhibitor of cysteine peptidase|nr:protease inhibitor I42 family protein [Acidobacteriota bacterium]
MKRTTASIICVLATAAGAYAVTARDGVEDEMPVFMMSEKAETCIQVAAGSLFAVRFLSSPGTGYSWALAAELDKKLLEFKEEKMEEPGSGLLGGRETVIWTFRALASGETGIAMNYARPWEKETPPAKTHVFKVKIL